MVLLFTEVCTSLLVSQDPVTRYLNGIPQTRSQRSLLDTGPRGLPVPNQTFNPSLQRAALSQSFQATTSVQSCPSGLPDVYPFPMPMGLPGSLRCLPLSEWESPKAQAARYPPGSATPSLWPTNTQTPCAQPRRALQAHLPRLATTVPGHRPSQAPGCLSRAGLTRRHISEPSRGFLPLFPLSASGGSALCQGLWSQCDSRVSQDFTGVPGLPGQGADQLRPRAQTGKGSLGELSGLGPPGHRPGLGSSSLLWPRAAEVGLWPGCHRGSRSSVDGDSCLGDFP